MSATHYAISSPRAILRSALGIPLRNATCDRYTGDFTCANVCALQGADLIRVSRFYKDSKEGKFVSYIHDDTRTLYDGFRKGAKESSKFTMSGDGIKSEDVKPVKTSMCRVSIRDRNFW